MNKLPDITKDFAAWYHEVVLQSKLADQAPTRGCIVMRPYGTAVWKMLERTFDKRLQELECQEATFPLLIPMSFLKKEASHVAGFSPELAVVTHAGGQELAEPYVVRPTSETIIHSMMAQWITSWRDLPMKLYQWGSVVRWEMRTRPFLRTTEFWWHEGHTAHATQQEAQNDAQHMLQEYKTFIEEQLAIPVVAARKSSYETFAGADATYCVESLMQDGKALQMGTSHVISQNFAKAFGIQFQDQKGTMAYPYLTSWGWTSRLIGALIMVHGDQKGLVLPPAIAPIQVIVIPIIKATTADEVICFAQNITALLQQWGIRVKLDLRDQETSGAKLYESEMQGIPLRIEIGQREVIASSVALSNRLDGKKNVVTMDNLHKELTLQIATMQQQLFDRAFTRQQENWHHEDRLEHIVENIDIKTGFYQTGWCGQDTCEQKIRTTKATIRCVLEEKKHAQCCVCNEKSLHDILCAKAY